MRSVKRIGDETKEKGSHLCNERRFRRHGVPRATNELLCSASSSSGNCVIDDEKIYRRWAFTGGGNLPTALENGINFIDGEYRVKFTFVDGREKTGIRKPALRVLLQPLRTQKLEGRNPPPVEEEPSSVRDLRAQAEEIERNMLAFCLNRNKKVNKKQTAIIMR